MIKGYKVFNPDWTCRDFQYEVGKEYVHEGTIIPCKVGFHFCSDLVDCFNYYKFDPSNKVAEVEALGEVKTDGDKIVTDHIRIVKELTWQEVLEQCNYGKGNTGHRNTGHYNTGHYNTGHHNTGYYNTGYYNTGHHNAGHYNAGDHNTGDHNTGDHNTGTRNTGHYNTGHHNTGHHNTGHRNTGNRNTGHRNTGNRNTGNFNSCDWSSGDFCSIEPPFLLFNKPSPITRDSWRQSEACIICSRLNIVDCEGKKIPYKQAWSNLWESLTDKEKSIIKAIPNFDADVFEDITGIKDEG